jgi:hypothetical protein
MKAIFSKQILESKRITHKDIKDIFDNEYEKSDDSEDEAKKDKNKNLDMEPELDENMFLALKIAFNLKELTYQQNVRKFFFSRFKRRLIKKSIIEKLEIKTEFYLD